MDNFISQDLGGLCLILWALIGIGFIWYARKIKQPNLNPEPHSELGQAESSEAPRNDASQQDNDSDNLNRPTHE